jgi:predicted DCC family thiol-disulfide oxidoreductase YuxK
MLTSTFATDGRQVLVYDGKCNLCQAGVQAMLVLDPAGKMRFSAMQSDAGKRLLAAIGRDPDDMSSVVLVEADGSYKTKSDAVLKAAQISENPAAVAAAFSTAVMPSWMRDAAYDGIASNRYSLFGQPEKPSLVDERFSDRFIV